MPPRYMTMPGEIAKAANGLHGIAHGRTQLGTVHSNGSTFAQLISHNCFKGGAWLGRL